MRDAWRPLLFLFALAALAAIVLVCLLYCYGAEAGVPSSWSVKQATEKGAVWGGGAKHVKGAKRMYELWYPYLWKYGGGRDPVTQSLIIWTETGHTGNPLAATPDKHLGEAGLLSVKRALARTFDIDACDPRQNVWAAAKGMQYRKRKTLQAYSWASKLSDEDLWFLVGMHGGSGDGAAACVLKFSEAKEKMQAKMWKGSLKLTIMGWLKEQDASLTDQKYDFCWGRTDAQTVAFRMARIHAAQKLVFQAYGKQGKKKWSKCIRPVDVLDVSPFGADQYPGDEEHGICHPTPAEAWDLPPAGHRRKQTKKITVDLWAPYCGTDALCLSGDSSSATYKVVWKNWKKARQADGLLPTDAEYAEAKAEMKEAGCWILD